MDVCAGDTLVFWPSHVHSTVCTSVTTEDGACVSVNAYIVLDERNYYVQSMIEDWLGMQEASANSPVRCATRLSTGLRNDSCSRRKNGSRNGRG